MMESSMSNDYVQEQLVQVTTCILSFSLTAGIVYHSSCSEITNHNLAM